MPPPHRPDVDVADIAVTPHAHPLAVAAVLLLGLTVTAVAWRSADATVEAIARREFGTASPKFAAPCAHAWLRLRAGAALSCGALRRLRTRDCRNWRHLRESLQLEQHYPGARGLGFVQRVVEPDRVVHEASVRGEGFTGYAIQPAGVRPSTCRSSN